jgi:hypothetical protein
MNCLKKESRMTYITYIDAFIASRYIQEIHDTVLEYEESERV